MLVLYGSLTAGDAAAATALLCHHDRCEVWLNLIFYMGFVVLKQQADLSAVCVRHTQSNAYFGGDEDGGVGVVKCGCGLHIPNGILHGPIEAISLVVCMVCMHFHIPDLGGCMMVHWSSAVAV